MSSHQSQMESALLGLVLDSSCVIAAERKKQTVPDFIEAILVAHSAVALVLSPVSVAELVHGIYRAKTADVAQRRRAFIEELVSLIPVRPVTKNTAWLVGQIEGQEGAKGNVLPFSDLMTSLILRIKRAWSRTVFSFGILGVGAGASSNAQLMNFTLLKEGALRCSYSERRNQ